MEEMVDLLIHGVGYVFSIVQRETGISAESGMEVGWVGGCVYVCVREREIITGGKEIDKQQTPCTRWDVIIRVIFGQHSR
jgi:hypothetical protein